MTNILTCPFETATNAKEGVYESVDETANTGVDVHMLQPGLGWVPTWPSRHRPMKDHYIWFNDTYYINGRDDFT